MPILETLPAKSMRNRTTENVCTLSLYWSLKKWEKAITWMNSASPSPPFSEIKGDQQGA